MGNVIPWSQIHPSITSEEPFVAVVIIDPQRQICVSEMVAFDPEALDSADIAASELIAAAQAAATKVASGYRVRRRQGPKLSPRFSTPERGPKLSPRFSTPERGPKLSPRFSTPERGPSPTVARKRGRENPSALTLPLPLEHGTENPGSPYQTLRVLKGGKD
jgi:hypothetical protein